MNTPRLASAGVLGLTLFLSACSHAPASMPSASPSSGTQQQASPTPAMTLIPTPVTMQPDEITGATIIAGKVVLIGKNGKFEILTGQEATIGSAKVTMDGKVMGRDGSSAKLTEGMVVDTQGAIKAVTTQTVIDAKRKLMIPQNASAVPEPVSGSYQDYTPGQLSAAQTGKVVLFFRAPWCPTCRALDADIMKNSGEIPGNIRILKVDYDTSEELKTKYGVTYQHTFVQVDADGKQLKKWNGSPTLSSLLSQII